MTANRFTNMRTQIGKLLMQLFGADLLARETTRFLYGQMFSYRTQIRRQIWRLCFRMALFLWVIMLVSVMAGLALVALALHLNALWGSDYMGMVAVSGAIAALLCLGALWRG